MHVGNILVAQGLLTQEALANVLLEQQLKGGTFIDCLVALGRSDRSKLEAAIDTAPRAPRRIADMGLSVSSLMALMLKSISVSGEATQSSIVDTLKLPPFAVQELFEHADVRQLFEVHSGMRGFGSSEPRYTLTQKGVDWAHEAMSQNEYLGPAPVTLDALRSQIKRQGIANERIDRTAIQQAFADLVVPGHLIDELGPALNSGRSILLYGPPGNGKTTIGARVAQLFNDVIYIPYCFEVEGQIIKLFDPTVHQEINCSVENDGPAVVQRSDDLDGRWVACRRPYVVTGGELTLEMLDLSFDPMVRFYQAPLHIKALGGVFLIDDFGRQLVSPKALLNRWIVPLGSGVDYLKLHTGKSFDLPFDELLIFSTNMPPQELMDAAFLRRIPYKIEMGPPSADEYRRIFLNESTRAGLAVDEATIEGIIIQLDARYEMPLASYQPRFIVEQILASAKFDGSKPNLDPLCLAHALDNLSARQSCAVRSLMEPGPRAGDVTILSTARQTQAPRVMSAWGAN